MSIANVKRYFKPKETHIHRVPRQTCEIYDIRYARYQEIMLIESGVARSPGEARRLMEKYQTLRAADVLKALPPVKKKTFWRKLQLLFIKIEGGSLRNPHSMKADYSMMTRFRYRE